MDLPRVRDPKREGKRKIAEERRQAFINIDAPSLLLGVTQASPAQGCEYLESWRDILKAVKFEIINSSKSLSQAQTLTK